MHEKTKLLNLTSDVIFKNFFMNENTIEYTAEFINLITGIPKEEIIKKAVFENIELPIINKNSKRYKCDIIIGIAKQLINLEMNASYYEGIIEKNNSYLFRMLGDRFNKGENYIDGKKIIQINIDNYKKYKGDKLLYRFTIKEDETLELETENYESYHISLPYLKEKCYNKEKLSRLEKLCEIFLFDDAKEAYKITGDDNVMKKAVRTLEELSQDENIVGLYDAEEVERKVWNTKLLYATKVGTEEGMKKGIKKGMEKGMEKGMKQGIKKGIEQGKNEAQIQTAQKLIKMGLSKEQIVEATGLSIEQLNNL